MSSGVAERADERTGPALIASSRAVVDPALRAAVDTLPGPIRLISGYHLGWWEPDGSECTAGAGKAIRPALALAAAEATGGDPAAAVPAAVAVELVHNFSLLHDDVMDGDATRRHRPTAWRVFGVNSAILAGDALLGLAMDIVADRPAAVRNLSRTVQDLLAGQAEDLAFEQRAEVTVAECATMAGQKTGALLGSACSLGALFGGAEPELIPAMQAFGNRLGLAFQHIDDLLGIWGDPALTGKPVHSDLSSRKKSLPVVAALASGTVWATRLRDIYSRSGPLNANDLALAASLVDLAGARRWSQEEADRLFTEAITELEQVCPGDTTGLAALATLITHRDH
ncbi:geranylgeranyl diphosphate synthase type I [Allocatelliglobosispora scoriae]|uniref:Geranylgeranyl diphosphate synthase type I n=1 Tax=Allocatelliglobosispora scoriae TaxID=643052 RepID=A0A841BTE8_9ACTN|nr:family 2 encapsulin nanocompartment cargo protein polyprenyl transferase [Allocatelliglobosispora scoriae]MBB5870193.1 geranylgeranyl diphosphate synthase type I [Allocatelliglobosispora scoriae]